MTRTKIGTGSTKRTRISYPGTLEGAKAWTQAMDGWVSPVGDFPIWLEQQIEALDKMHAALSCEPSKPFETSRWYVEELLNKAHILGARLAAGDLNGALGWAMEFGHLSREMDMKFPTDEILADRNKYRKIEDNRIVNSNAARQLAKEKWQRRVDEVIPRFPESLSENWSAAAAFIERELEPPIPGRRTLVNYLKSKLERRR